MNALMVAPAYWIKDYLDDKASIKVSLTYGTKDEDNPYTPPVLNTDAVIVAEPPGNKTGALLDASSVKVYLDECRVLIGQDTTTGVPSVANSNYLDCTGAAAAFKTALADVLPGDYLIIENPAGGGASDLVKRVQAVVSTAGSEAIYTMTNFAAATAGLSLRIERQVTDVLVGSSFITVNKNAVTIGGGVTTLLTGETVARAVQYGQPYIEYRSLRQDLCVVDTVSSSTDVTTKIGKVDSRNPLAGMCTAALANTLTPIQFFGLKTDDAAGHNYCMDVIEGRTDIYAIVPATTSVSILTTYKTAVEGLASVTLASTTGIPQKFRVVIGSQALPTSKVISGTTTGYTAGAHNTVDAAVPNTAITVADAIGVFADGDADFVTDGVRAGDILVVTNSTGAVNLGSYAVAEVYDKNRLRTTTAFTAQNTALAGVHYYIIRSTGTLVASTAFTGGLASAGSSADALDGRVTMTGAAGLTTYAGKVLRLSAEAGNAADWLIVSCTAATPGVATVDHGTKTLAADAVGNTVGAIYDTVSYGINRTVAMRRPFRIITDNNATFITDLVKAGDYLQVPNPITGSSYTASFAHKIAYISSENTVVLDTNVDCVATDPEAGDTTLKFRVSRTLSKDDQVKELGAIAQSFNSKRVILVWPDSIKVTGLKDGSKTRAVSTKAENADAQPGYYMSAVVGGMTAGLPSHQGFTNLGIAGIDEITNSTRYFSDTQITKLSDSGWFVFVQASPNTLPYCVHQLTTDADALETGEYSLVKNFDFISLFYRDIVDDYLGDWNINTDTIDFIKADINAGTDLLKLRKVAKIGAPIISATLSSIAQHKTAKDRVEAYLNVTMPKPLNVIGLHILSS